MVRDNIEQAEKFEKRLKNLEETSAKSAKKPPKNVMKEGFRIRSEKECVQSLKVPMQFYSLSHVENFLSYWNLIFFVENETENVSIQIKVTNTMLCPSERLDPTLILKHSSRKK